MPQEYEQEYRVRFAHSSDDIKAAQRLRQRCFGTAATDGRDQDQFDVVCRHLLVEKRATGRLVCCCRLMRIASGAHIGASYSAQYYDLAGLGHYPDPLLEIGRFCIEPSVQGGDVVRAAWAALTQYVDQQGIKLLFGCSTFQGTDADAYRGVFAHLKAQYLAPEKWRPGVKTDDIIPFPDSPELKQSVAQTKAKIPPLLRSYLAMGGLVSDHAVVDQEMGSLHVFTGLDIAAIPPARARLLRAIASAQAA
ncbi:MAG: GNAT family N-acetyltransferase [Marinosulfonomonas sp.]|nr:GNAT family N-acetyltransferase [Marinosulfonomonas sp.]